MKSFTRRGQTAMLFTLAAVPLFGMIGLAVDIGWAHFRQEAAQTAADAAAMGAAKAAYTTSGGTNMLCGVTQIACYASEYTCPATFTGPPANNIEAGCMWAKENGFVTGGRQKVTIQSGVGSPQRLPASPCRTGLSFGFRKISRSCSLQSWASPWRASPLAPPLEPARQVPAAALLPSTPP
jgi:hypothetical protein